MWPWAANREDGETPLSSNGPSSTRHTRTVRFSLAGVRHERGQKTTKCFGISSGNCRVCTTFSVEFEVRRKDEAELLQYRSLLGSGFGDAAEPYLAPVGSGQDDVGALQSGKQ